VYGTGDYTITQIGGGLDTTLERTAFSNIPDGDRVHVDYEYELAGDNDTLTTGANVHTALTLFEHWGVYGRYDSVDFHVLSGDEDDLRFNDFDRYVAGAEFTWPWFRAEAEFEENDASFGAFWGYSGSVSFFTYGVRSWNARLNADYDHRNYTDSSEIVDRYSVSGSSSRRLFRRGLLEVEGSWLRGRWQSSTPNDIDTLFLKLKYSWWYGKIEVKLETGFAQILRPTEDRQVFKFDLRVRRVF
jgi:hypothetical protein